MSRFHIIEQERQDYTIRMGGCVVAALVLMIVAFRFWPAPTNEVPDIIYDARAQELIQIEEIQPTQQKQSRPPPPAPLIPIVVPDDIILDEIEIELTDELAANDLGEDVEEETDGAQVPVTGGSTQPDAGPRAFRVVQPEYTREARRRNIRAEIIVEVLVNQSGRVESAKVVDRFLLSGKDNDERESVPEIGYGVEDAALAAAREFMFRPARESGQRVSALTLLTFRVGG
ncbi:MAG: energy transducer TonB [Rhodothermales bacterium]|nr:energy transducer TonB [Rhodothermales bacterium]